ncbi:MAG: dephospho-CoA kinase [Gammaproteobacteria bacterium]|nr:dephospho-CoA kinase [Gammaproteobacteria bacterium]
MTVALTGGIGSGKSMISGLFAALGVPVVDADEISRRVSQPGGIAYPAMAALLGPDAVAGDGSIRRDRARRRVFQDDALRRKLEEIVHPLVREEITRSVATIDHPYCIVSIPLLVESGDSGLFDRVLVVDGPEAMQVSRTMERDGVAADDVRQIQARQADRDIRIAAADDIIDNGGSIDALRRRVQELHAMYLRLAARRPHERNSGAALGKGQ